MAADSTTDIEVVRIPLIGAETNRSTTASKDMRFVNAYFDLVKNEVTGKATFFLVKRPGLSQNIRPPAGNATARGFTSWNGKVYSCYGDKLYSNTTDLGVTLTTSTGMCGFASTRESAGTRYLAITDGVKLFRISTADAVTTVTTIPANTGDLIYFDGIFFVFGTDGSLWNSAIDDPTTWAVINFITPIMQNGSEVALARQGDFLIAFLTNSFQGFFNNANPVGPPIENYPQVMKEIGCASRNSVAGQETMLFWVGSGQTGGQAVWRMDNPGQAREVSNSSLERILNAETTDIATCNGKFVRTCGHSFYILKLTGSDRTFVYDADIEMWFEWQVAGASTAFPIIAYAQHNSVLLAQHPTNGWIYNVLPTVYQDDSVNFTVLARLGRVDMDTYLPKFMKSIALVGDIQSSTTNVDLQYSDDDYVTLSTARTLDMSLAYPFTPALGKFNRRAWQLSYAGSNPLRIESLELRYRLGEL